MSLTSLRAQQRGEGDWSSGFSASTRPRFGCSFPVPASNAYNPFGKPMAVQYAPIREFQQGLLPTQFTESETRQRNVNLGLIWQLGGHELNFELTRTRSERETFRVLAKARRARWDPTADGWYAALSSSDPNRAINVFGNGEAQGSAFA